MQQQFQDAPSSRDSWSGSNRHEARVSDLMAQARRRYFSKEYLKAAELVELAISLSPSDPDLWNTRGVFLRAGGRSAEAAWSYRRALAEQPDNAGFWSNLGNALADLKQLETAMVCHKRAISIEPAAVEFHRNLALALTVASRHSEALESLNHALRIDPANIGARFDRSMAYLHLGEYARGWADYEVRLHNTTRALPGKRWTGEPYPGKTLLITS